MTQTKGIITATDSRGYECCLLMVKSVRLFHPDIPIQVNDLGLTEEEKQEMSSVGAEVVTPNLDHIKGETKRMGDWYAEDWKYWAKPYVLVNSPFDLTLWIDIDCIVVKSLNDCFKEIEQRKFLIVREYLTEVAGCPHIVRNHPQLYIICRVPKQMEVGIGAGVIGFSDKTIIHEWAKTCSFLIHSRYTPYVAWWDQGAMLLTLEKMKLADISKADIAYNYTLQVGQRKFQIDGINSIPGLRSVFPKATILHYCGKPKMYRYDVDKWRFEQYDEPTKSWQKKG